MTFKKVKVIKLDINQKTPSRGIIKHSLEDLTETGVPKNAHATVFVKSGNTFSPNALVKTSDTFII